MSPGILLSSGYIAGGTIAGIVAACLAIRYKSLAKIGPAQLGDYAVNNWTTIVAFGVLCVLLFLVGSRRNGEQTVH